MKILLLLNMLLVTVNSYAQNSQSLAPSGLMCDLISNTDQEIINGYIASLPVGQKHKNVQLILIGSENPSFSWELNDKGTNVKQVAYQLIIADNEAFRKSGNSFVWDSEKVQDDKSSGIVRSDFKLKPNTKYYWKVRVWNNYNQMSPYSLPMSFYTDRILTTHKTPFYPLEKMENNPISLKGENSMYHADFGKDAFGQLKIRLFSEKESDSVIVHLGEALNSFGQINRKPGGSIRYSRYVVKLQKGLHIYQLQLRRDILNTRPAAIKMPDYIGEVTPFRYCEVEGYKHKLSTNDFTRIAVNYKFNDAAVHFKSTDTMLNSIWELCKYSIKATSFAGIYVDGDRERIPYEADAYINQLSHYAVDKEFTLARRSHEYLIENATWPTEWILQSVLMAGNDYLYTGDLKSAKYHYNNLKSKCLIGLEDSTQLISTTTGRQNKQLLESIHFPGSALRDIVDWPHGGILGLNKKEPGETDGFVFTRYNAVVNAFYYKALTVMASIAQDLGEVEDAVMFKNKASQVKKAFHRTFYDQKQKVYKDGADTKHASLHTNMFALAFGLVNSPYQKEVLEFVKSRGMACSVYGSQFLLDAIYDLGDGKYGLSLLTAKDDRSWYNMIQAGSTITMEAWDNKYKPNQDWNHAWGAAPANIISRKLMGIEPLAPGWSNFSVKPQIAGIAQARIDVPTIKGTIHADYMQDESSFTIKISVPTNTQSQIFIPLRDGKKYTIWMNDKKLNIAHKKQGLISNVGSGSHIIKILYSE